MTEKIAVFKIYDTDSNEPHSSTYTLLDDSDLMCREFGTGPRVGMEDGYDVSEMTVSRKSKEYKMARDNSRRLHGEASDPEEKEVKFAKIWSCSWYEDGERTTTMYFSKEKYAKKLLNRTLHTGEDIRIKKIKVRHGSSRYKMAVDSSKIEDDKYNKTMGMCNKHFEEIKAKCMESKNKQTYDGKYGSKMRCEDCDVDFDNHKEYDIHASEVHNLVHIGCRKHGSFWMNPDAHLAGHACPSCPCEHCGVNGCYLATH